MGFFSWKCKHCNRSILNTEGVNQKNAWMARAVAILASGNILKGDYDGYGRVGGASLPDLMGAQEPDLYHASCWELAGKPTSFKGGSLYADDQGWFYDEADYDLKDPLGAQVPADGGGK